MRPGAHGNLTFPKPPTGRIAVGSATKSRPVPCGRGIGRRQGSIRTTLALAMAPRVPSTKSPASPTSEDRPEGSPKLIRRDSCSEKGPKCRQIPSGFGACGATMTFRYHALCAINGGNAAPGFLICHNGFYWSSQYSQYSVPCLRILTCSLP